MKSAGKYLLPIVLLVFLLAHCAEPNDPVEDTGPDIPSIDDTSSISIVTWNIKNFPQSGGETVDRVQLVLDSLDADVYCLQEIQDMVDEMFEANRDYCSDYKRSDLPVHQNIE